MILSFRTRMLIALAFIAGFVLVAPPLIWYTSGLRYDWKRGEWFNPGWIILESIPAKSQVWLNGRDAGLKTPAAIKNLRPDEYQVEVKSDGYYPWSKKLNVQAGLATFARNIRLFKKGAAQALSENWEKAVPSPLFDKLALIQNSASATDKPGRLAVFDGNNDQLEEAGRLNSSINEVIWDNAGETIILKLADGKKAVWRSGRSGVANLSYPPLKKEKIFSDPNELYGFDAGMNLMKVSLANGVTTTVLENAGPDAAKGARTFQDFELLDKNIYLLEDTAGSGTHLVGMRDNGDTQVITDLPSSNYHFLRGSPVLTILDERNNQVYVIEPEKPLEISSPKMIASATGGAWDKNGERLLYYTSREIAVWNRKTEQKELITRLGSKIYWAAWLPSEDYLIFAVRPSASSAVEIRTIELDSRDQRNTAAVDSLNMPQATEKTADPHPYIPIFSRRHEGRMVFTDGAAGSLTLFQQELE